MSAPQLDRNELFGRLSDAIDEIDLESMTDVDLARLVGAVETVAARFEGPTLYLVP